MIILGDISMARLILACLGNTVSRMYATQPPPYGNKSHKQCKIASDSTEQMSLKRVDKREQVIPTSCYSYQTNTAPKLRKKKRILSNVQHDWANDRR